MFVLRTFDDAVRLRGAVTSARLRASAAWRRERSSWARRSPASRSRASCAARTPGQHRRARGPVLPRAAHPACAEAVERHLRSRGHDLRLGVSATVVERHDERLQVTLKAGVEAFDLVVVCTGSRPNLALLEESGLTAGAALDVDERCRSAAPGLFAAGDVARTLDPVSGERVVVGLVVERATPGTHRRSRDGRAARILSGRRSVHYPARGRAPVRRRRIARRGGCGRRRGAGEVRRGARLLGREAGRLQPSGRCASGRTAGERAGACAARSGGARLPGRGRGARGGQGGDGVDDRNAG